MLELFNTRSEINTGILSDSEFDYVRVSYMRELANIQDYYRSRVYAVKSNHLLVSLLLQLDAPISYSAEQYFSTVSVRAPYIANAFRLTSELQPGNIFTGVFYDHGCQEIIISNSDYVNPVYAEQNWKRISAVETLTHFRSDLGLLLPNGKNTGTETGLAVISVNLPLLSLQYRCFVREQQRNTNTSEQNLGIAHFVHMYVLPNMLFSHTDIALINRAMNLFYGAPMGQATARHSFPVLDYSKRVDKVYTRWLKTAQSKSQLYSTTLQSLLTVVSKNAEEALILPNLAPTRQVLWALTLARLKYIKFLLDVGGVRNIAYNRTSVNNTQRQLKRLNGENIYPSVIQGDLLQDTSVVINDILEM
jgi:hypothetical protein